MLLSQEYQSIIATCREKYERGEYSLQDCLDCPTIHIAYFLRTYTFPTHEKIESILKEKLNE